MKFGIISDEIINLQAQSGHLKVYAQLHLSERGKQRTPQNDYHQEFAISSTTNEMHLSL